MAEYDSSVKQNTGKPPVFQGAIAYFPRALRAVSGVSEFGKTKYNAEYRTQGWRAVAVDDLLDSVCRHIVDREIEGEINHADGGVMHLAQVAWEALAALENRLAQNEEVPNIGPWIKKELNS